MMLRIGFSIFDCRFSIVGSATALFIEGQCRLNSINQQSAIGNRQFLANQIILHDHLALSLLKMGGR